MQPHPMRPSVPCSSLLGRCRCALAHCFKQTHATGHRHVQAFHAAGHRNADQRVAGFAREAPHALALGTHHDGDGSLEIRLVEILFGFIGRANHPHATLLQLAQRARQVGHGDVWD
eukprot:18577-Eustigmatos_ZCMA.PRE.1